MGLLFYQSAYLMIIQLLWEFYYWCLLTLIGNMIADLVLLKLNPNYEEK